MPSLLRIARQRVRPHDDPRTAARDADALDHIALMLRAPEWDSAADFLEAIHAIVTGTGRNTDHDDDGCTGCGLDGLSGSGCSWRR